MMKPGCLLLAKKEICPLYTTIDSCHDPINEHYVIQNNLKNFNLTTIRWPRTIPTVHGPVCSRQTPPPSQHHRQSSSKSSGNSGRSCLCSALAACFLRPLPPFPELWLAPTADCKTAELWRSWDRQLWLDIPEQGEPAAAFIQLLLDTRTDDISARTSSHGHDFLLLVIAFCPASS